MLCYGPPHPRVRSGFGIMHVCKQMCNSSKMKVIRLRQNMKVMSHRPNVLRGQSLKHAISHRVTPSENCAGMSVVTGSGCRFNDPLGRQGHAVCTLCLDPFWRVRGTGMGLGQKCSGLVFLQAELHCGGLGLSARYVVAGGLG